MSKFYKDMPEDFKNAVEVIKSYCQFESCDCDCEECNFPLGTIRCSDVIEMDCLVCTFTKETACKNCTREWDEEKVGIESSIGYLISETTAEGWYKPIKAFKSKDKALDYAEAKQKENNAIGSNVDCSYTTIEIEN